MTEFLNDESGAALIEYALIAAIVSISAIGGLMLVGSKVGSMLTSISFSPSS